jgi:hypothetical protein
VAQQVYYWSSRTRELFHGRMAQRREERRQREAYEQSNGPPAEAVSPPVPTQESKPDPAPAASPVPEIMPVTDSPPLISAEEAKMAPTEPVEAADEKPKPKRARRKKKNEADSAGEGTPPGGV